MHARSARNFLDECCDFRIVSGFDFLFIEKIGHGGFMLDECKTALVERKSGGERAPVFDASRSRVHAADVATMNVVRPERLVDEFFPRVEGVMDVGGD